MNGFALNGSDVGDESGFSVSSAGDVNGDGFADVIIGTRFADPNGGTSGESYVVFGHAGPYFSSFELSSLDGSNGFALNGSDENDRFGYSVSAAGDVNGDGFDDVLVGASDGDPNGKSKAGESYVLFGREGGFPSSLEASLLDGGSGFVVNGIDANDESGFSLSSAGDVNGDGFDDVLIGARYADPNGNGRAGESYVVFGQASVFSASFDLSSLDGDNGFVLNGIDSDDGSGGRVSSAGDVNGDGFDDLIIGARGADPVSDGGGDEGGSGPGGPVTAAGAARNNAGESYIVFGSNFTDAVTHAGDAGHNSLTGGMKQLMCSLADKVVTRWSAAVALMYCVAPKGMTF